MNLTTSIAWVLRLACTALLGRETAGWPVPPGTIVGVAAIANSAASLSVTDEHLVTARLAGWRQA